MQRTKKPMRSIGLFAVLCLVIAACGGDGAAEGDGNYVIGVSNTLVGNGWREQMICAIKAEAASSGVVDEVVVVNRNGGPTEQIADLESLISQGVDAIILNPTDREASELGHRIRHRAGDRCGRRRSGSDRRRRLCRHQ